MKLLASIGILLAAWISPVPAYTVGRDGSLYTHDLQHMRIKGISWFGLETPDLCPNGMWSSSMAFFMDTMAADGFNVIRVPFSAQFAIYHFDDYPDMSFVSADPPSHHKKSIEILDALFDMAHARNMLILLDLHRLNWGYISELWYDPNDATFAEEQFYDAWFAILDRYHAHPALWGLDLLNEPHGRAEWGTGNPVTDWKKFAESALHEFENRYTNATWLYVVEGIEWGKQVSGAVAFPITPPKSAQRRLAYSAHNYGKSVVFSVDVYNKGALHYDWDNHFGVVREHGHAVIIGEWGGRVDLDAEWMTTFVEYLRDKNMTDTFFWSLGPNSGDVAGYLQDDWKTVDPFKRQVTAQLQPNPFPVAKT